MGGDDMRDVLDVVEWAAARLPGPEKHVAVIGCARAVGWWPLCRSSPCLLCLAHCAHCAAPPCLLVALAEPAHVWLGRPHSRSGTQPLCSSAPARLFPVHPFACAPYPAPRSYSWGSCLAAHGLSHPAVAAYVGVSVPLGGMAWVLQTKKHFGEVCRAIHLPRLLLLGDQVGHS